MIRIDDISTDYMICDISNSNVIVSRKVYTIVINGDIPAELLLWIVYFVREGGYKWMINNWYEIWISLVLLFPNQKGRVNKKGNWSYNVLDAMKTGLIVSHGGF